VQAFKENELVYGVCHPGEYLGAGQLAFEAVLWLGGTAYVGDVIAGPGAPDIVDQVGKYGLLPAIGAFGVAFGAKCLYDCVQEVRQRIRGNTG
jgi:hypothetical protein